MYLVYQLLGRHLCSVVPCSAHRRSKHFSPSSYADIVVYLLHTTSTVTLGKLQEPPKLQVLHQWVSIVVTQWKEYCEEGKVVVLGEVRHSYAASKSLLKPWGIIQTNGTAEVAHCTCMAGSAVTCSHIGAILHWVKTAAFIRSDTPCTSLEDASSSPGFMPSFTCIPGPSRKIEAPSPSEIEYFFI